MPDVVFCAATVTAMRPRPRGQGAVTDTVTVTVTTDEAARRAGVSARTIRRWIQRGVLPATETPEGYLIAPANLLSVVAAPGQRSRPRGHAATDAATTTDTAAATATDTATVTDTGVSVNANARDQLMAVRDEWLAPLVAQITAQAERIGRLEAASEAKDAAIAAKDETLAAKDELITDLRAELRRHADLRRVAAAQAAPDAPGSTEGAPPDNPSGAPAAGFLVRVWRAFGRGRG